MEKLLYKEMSYKTRGACFEVYKKFGGAFKELVINKALTLELNKTPRIKSRNSKTNSYYLSRRKSWSLCS